MKFPSVADVLYMSINLVFGTAAFVGLVVAIPFGRLYDKWRGPLGRPETDAEIMAAEHAQMPWWVIPLGFIVIGVTLTGLTLLVGPLGTLLLVVGPIAAMYAYAWYVDRG